MLGWDIGCFGRGIALSRVLDILRFSSFILSGDSWILGWIVCGSMNLSKIMSCLLRWGIMVGGEGGVSKEDYAPQCYLPGSRGVLSFQIRSRIGNYIQIQPASSPVEVPKLSFRV